MICPIYHTGEEFWKLFEDRPADEFVTDNTYIVTLYNSAFSDDFKKMTAEDILRQHWTISNIFKKALK